jgi:LacI family transcriptional regulator
MTMDPNDGWRGPTVKDVAEAAGVAPATVDRVLNKRPGVKEGTRQKVMAAFDKLSQERKDPSRSLDIVLFCESGETFNAKVRDAMDRANRTIPNVFITGHFETTFEMDPIVFARQLETLGGRADGVIVTAREHPAINRAIRRLEALQVPVVCLTTDLPSSRRTAYVGNDQYAAGSVAGQLIGNAVAKDKGNVLLVMSVAFRCQQEREMGFRRALRADFSHLKIDERVFSNDTADQTYRQIMSYFKSHGLPAAIYNVAGANRGVARALTDVDLDRKCVFVGHELTMHSRNLLESGVMNYVISHNFVDEVTGAIAVIKDTHNAIKPHSRTSHILVHTKYNCEL